MLAERARRLHAASGRRVVIGITGSPGAGKTTLARRLVDELNGDAAADAVAVADVGPSDSEGGAGRVAVHLPMDGFHLANATLDRLGLRDRKGAIETFDGWGFLALLERVRREPDHVVYAPAFERQVDEPVAGEIAIGASARFVVVEGNYLLADAEPWRRVRGLVDEAWFCETDDVERTSTAGSSAHRVRPLARGGPSVGDRGRRRECTGHRTVTGPGGPRRVGRDLGGRRRPGRRPRRRPRRRPSGVTDPAQPAVRTLPYWSTVMIAVSFLRFSAR